VLFALLQQEHSNAPSTATIYEWIQKYTQYATDSIKDYHPKVGDTWIADETVLEIDGQNLWILNSWISLNIHHLY
jgi:putative transposase